MGKLRRVVRHHPFALFVVSAVFAIVSVLGLAAVVRSSVLGDAGSVSSDSPVTTAPSTTTPATTIGPATDKAAIASESVGSTAQVSAGSGDALAGVLDVRDLDHSAAVLDLTGRCLATYDTASQDALYSVCNDLAIRHLATGRRANCNSWPTLRMLFDKFMSVVSEKPGDRTALKVAMSERDLAYISCASGG